MNNENWSIGDIAICIDDTSWKDGYSMPVKKFEEYRVQGIDGSCSCGRVALDLGFRGSIWQCQCICGNLSAFTQIWWLNSTRFIKKQDLTSQIEKALESDSVPQKS